MEVNDFVDTVLTQFDIDPDRVIVEIISHCNDGDLTRARECVDVGNQVVADRIVQEIVCEDSRVTNEGVRAAMPLVEVTEDLGRIGEISCALHYPTKEMTELHMRERVFHGLAPDGTAIVTDETQDKIQIPQWKLDVVSRITGGFNGDTATRST